MTDADATDLAAGCSGFSWSQIRPALDIDGLWTDSYGYDHDVSPFAWNDNTVTQYDNDAQFIIAQNSPDDAWSPDLWSKYNWTTDDDGDLFYCQIAYAEATEADALAVTDADATDLASGCNGFPWTNMTP